jgi:DNA polymerase-1
VSNKATTSHKFLQLPDYTLGTYNAYDTHFTAQLVAPLVAELESNGQWQHFQKWTAPFQEAVVDMQVRGLRLDKGALHEYKRAVTKELREADRVVLDADPSDRLTKPTPKSPNGIGSPKRLGEFLFQTLGLKPLKRTAKGFDSTDQESLYRILRDLRKKDEPHRPILESLFHRSRLNTIRSRYLNLHTDDDGRVRPTVKMTAAKTWRLAYAGPPLQQFPPEARHVLVPEPGHVFLSLDKSQLEARILAYLSDDHVSIEVFEAGDDVHSQNARDLFGWSLAEWVVLDPLVREGARNFSKAFLYGISYGGEAETMKTKDHCPCPRCAHLTPPTLAVKRTELRAIEDRWYGKHHAVGQFHEALKDQVDGRHYWDCPLGGRRWFSAPWSAELSREVKNCPMQTTAAKIMERNQVELYRAEAPIVLQMHDEFVLEVPEGEAPSWRDRCLEIMDRPLTDAGPLNGVSFPAQAKVGETWGTLEKMAA